MIWLISVLISDLLYLLHLLWIVILTVVVVLSQEGNVIHLIYWHWKKNAFGFCTVIVLFTLGAYLIQLFNKVFDFIWSISTHGINICVV